MSETGMNIFEGQKCYDLFVERIGIEDLIKQLKFLYYLPYSEESEGIINFYEYIKEQIENEYNIQLHSS